MLIQLILLFFIQITYSYKTNPTPWLCTESLNEISPTLPSCLPGYVIDIENVIYESTTDNSCSGTTLCSKENKNTLLFACNRKRTCNLDINKLSFYINATCGTAIRFFTKYHCLPVIQEQKDYLCEASTSRRASLGDINLSCERNYRLHITKALIGISIKQQDENLKSRFKCNKDTQWTCNHYVPNAYRDVCNNQLKQECKIRYNERPPLRDCQYGTTSNFSMVEYSCIPGDGIIDDLPRIDICSTDISERISVDRGLLHSPNYPQSLGTYLSCKKQLYVSRESRLRLFMLEKTLEYSHEINIRLLNNIRTLALEELFDTTVQNDEMVQFELKTNHVGDGQFLLYFQIDSRISEFAPFVFELERKHDGDDRRGKKKVKLDWGIIIGCIGGLLLVIILVAIVLTLIRISRRRRARSLRYLKSDDDHRQHLNAPATSPNHHQNVKPDQIDKPYLISSSPAILPLSSGNGHHRPHSASSTTSSIIIHQKNDGLSDRESLIKPSEQMQSRTNAENIDNFYEEIKEQQQQTALALGANSNKGDLINPYLEAKSIEQKKPPFQGNNSAQPIRDHHENEQRYQHPNPLANPEASDAGMKEQTKPRKKPPPKIPPQRMDLTQIEPSAPPLHLIENHISEDH